MMYATYITVLANAYTMML